jgi:hypothetical protein
LTSHVSSQVHPACHQLGEGCRRRVHRDVAGYERTGAILRSCLLPPFRTHAFPFPIQIINAVQLYDRMSKPVELDSDEEAIEEAKALAASQGLSVPASATPHDRNALSPPSSPTADNDDAQSISSRLSAFEMQDREVDKIQRTQRRRLERHLSSRGQVPTLGHPDLQDLAFGSTANGCVILLILPLHLFFHPPSLLFSPSTSFPFLALTNIRSLHPQFLPSSSHPTPFRRRHLPPRFPLRLLRLRLRHLLPLLLLFPFHPRRCCCRWLWHPCPSVRSIRPRRRHPDGDGEGIVD